MPGKAQFYKVFRNAVVFTIIFGWLFSGWPQVWQNPAFPPKTEGVKALTLTHSPIYDDNISAWTNPTYAYADGAPGYSYITSGSPSTAIAFSSYNFSLTGNTIDQVRVRVDASSVGGAAATTTNLLPTYDYGMLGFTPAQPPYTHHQKVNDSSDSTYIVAATATTGKPGYDLFSNTSTANGVFSVDASSTIRNMAVYFRAKDASNGTNDIRAACNLNTSVYGGVSVNPSTTITDYKHYFKTNPATTLAWTPQEINGTAATNNLLSFGVMGTDFTPNIYVYQVYATASYTTADNEKIRVDVSWDGGTTWSASKHVVQLYQAEGTYWVDVTSDTAWTPDKLSNANFRVRVDALTVGDTGQVRLDWIPVEVNYTVPASAPTVTTQAATNVGTTTSTANGNITDTGGEDASAWGVCYKTSSGCTTADSVAAGSGSGGVGAFTTSLSSLLPGTLYYYKAYATNSGGTSYGGEVSTTTKPAAPTSVNASDGTYSDKVTITWTQSTGATNYRVYRDGVNVGGLLGNVATYDDTGADTPTITPGAARASDGASTAQTNLDFSAAPSANPGTNHSYTVVAINTTGPSPVSSPNSGYRSVGSLNYQWYRSSGTGDSGYTRIDGATASTYSDTGAPAPTIISGTATASDGSATNKVALSISGETANVGVTRYYVCQLSATGASNATSTSNDGYRSVGALQYQWYRSSGTGDSGYSSLGSATTDPYDDLTAPAPTITPGTASASDGTTGSFVTLSLADETTAAGAARYYYCALTATGATPQDTNHDQGNIGVGTLIYQWQRSASDDVGSVYSDISSGTTDPYNDTEAPADGSGRYYRCILEAAGAANATSTADRGYKLLIAISITANNTVTYGILSSGGNKSTIQLGTTPAVKNEGSGAEDFKVAGQNTSCPWTLTTAAGNAQYKHEVSTSSGSTWMTVSTSQKFLISNIAQNASTNMDLRITVPTVTTCYNQQAVGVTVTAYQN